MTQRKRKTVKELNPYLVRRVDLFAASLLDDVGKQNPPFDLDKRFEVLDKLSRWLAVRNKIAALDNPDSEGSQLNDLRKRLKGDPARRKISGSGHFTNQPEQDARPGEFVIRRYGRRPSDGRPGDGDDLAALKARLPRADAGGDDDDCDDAEREDDSAAGDDRSVHAELHGDPDGNDAGADRGRDV